MPTSRRRTGRKRQRPQARQHPYETLVRGVHDDETLNHWYLRALWSFHRGPLPTQSDERLQNAAMARALEWFLFDLRLPTSGTTAAEMWIDTQTKKHAWGEVVQQRYRRFTRGQYGLFEVRNAPLPVLFLDELGTGRRVHAVNTGGWLVPEEGDVIAARLFPLEDDRAVSRSPEVLELSPGSDVVLEADREVVERHVGTGALEVEALFGASAGWIANAIGDRALTKVADHFFMGITGGSLRAEIVQRELRAADDPARLITDVLSEVEPLTPQEPPLFATLVDALWLGLRVDEGASASEMETFVAELGRRLAPLAPAPARPVRAPLQPVYDEAFHLSQHEAARVRALPETAATEWVGCRVRMRTPIAERGKLPYYPDGVFWVDRASGMIAGAAVVHPDAPASIVLRSLVDAVLQPLAPARPHRPSRVSVGSRTLAARLAHVLTPLGISVGLRYVDPALGFAMSEIERRATDEGAIGDEDGLVTPGSGGYLSLPGSTPSAVGRFFDASARFYRAAPWRVLADDRWIELGIPGLTSTGARAEGVSILNATAVVMGNGGETFGLALYFDPVDLDTLMSADDPAVALEFDSLAITFDAERETEPDVVAEAKAERWAVAGRRAYPSGLRTQPDAPPRLIAGGELDLATAALDAVREFVVRHEQSLRSPQARCTDWVDVEQVGAVRLTLEPEVLGDVE